MEEEMLSRALAAAFAACLGLIPATRVASAPAAPIVDSSGNKAEANAWTIGLAGGLLEGSFIRYAADLAKVLDDGDNLRVIPLVTYGAVGNINDLLYLRGVDLAITQSDVLDYFKTDLGTPHLAERIHYIAPLFHSEVHVCAKPEYRSLSDLAGKKVVFNTRGSAANLTGGIVFRRLGIQVETILMNNAVALQEMPSTDIAAIVHVVAKPNDLFASYKGTPPCRFLPVDYTNAFSDLYDPTTLTSDDYPAFIPRGGSVATIAVPAVLAVFNWPRNNERYRKVSRFIDAFFTKFEQLQRPPFQPKWREINLAATVPGWKRYAAAEEALAKLSTVSDKQTRDKFETFLAERGGAKSLSAQDREMLFREFQRWDRR
jgi:TRAP-type uncharacterized transport system substrate-binding protein